MTAVVRVRLDRLLAALIVLVLVLAAAIGDVVGSAGGTSAASSPRAASRVELRALEHVIKPIAATPGDPIYMNIPNIPGGSKGVGFKGWLDIKSWSWGATAPVSSGTGGGTGRVTFGDVIVTTPMSKAVPRLLSKFVTGTSIPSVTVEFVRPDAQGKAVTYLTVTLSNVTLPAFAEKSTGATPVDAVTLHFTQIDYNDNADGVEFCWNTASTPC